MKTLLIPYMEAGSGHRRPAEAVAETLARRHPGKFRIVVVDPGAEMGLATDRFLKWSWDVALAHPRLARWGYGLVQAPWSRGYLPTLFRQLQERGVAFLQERRPDIVFSTHFFWLGIAATARRRHGWNCPVLGYVIDPHRLWAEPRADGIAYDPLVMPHPEGQLRGVPTARIRALPFPVSARFGHPPDPGRCAARSEELGLVPGRLTVLVSQGGQGIGRTGALVAALHRRNLPLNLVVACGRNAALRARLTGLAEGRPSSTRLIPLGYADDMATLMALADVVVCKGGPSTTFEAVSLGKPILYTHWATYTEKPLVDGMVARGCAWFVPTARTLGDRLAMFVEEPGRLGEARKAMGALGYAGGADAVADWIAEAAR